MSFFDVLLLLASIPCAVSALDHRPTQLTDSSLQRQDNWLGSHSKFSTRRFSPHLKTLYKRSPVVHSNSGNIRLPNHIRPRHYDVTLRPLLGDLDREPLYDGQVEIIFESQRPTTSIILNVNGPLISTWKLRFALSNEDAPTVSKMVSDEVYQQVTFILNTPLMEGHAYVMTLQFQGRMSPPSLGRGLYWGHYQDGSKNKLMAATHFSPADARRAFPCFDEPALKATFNVSVWRQPGMTSLSNMPKLRSERQGSLIVDHFATTPKMSTYLLAVVVSDLPYLQTRRRTNDMPIRVWTVPGALPKADYILRLVDPLLDFFENYTGFPFDLPKLDIVGVPDHPVSAMENWGLIIYRQESMWYSERDDLSAHQLQVTLTLAHELAHMWFGNVITPGWWSDLWLKEGFASFFMFKAVQHVLPNWDMEELLVVRNMHLSLGLDNWPVTKPVIMDVDRPNDILSIFNQRAYSKVSRREAVLCGFGGHISLRHLTLHLVDRSVADPGIFIGRDTFSEGACILRSLEYLLGEVPFRTCMQNLLLNFTFSSFSTSDVWEVCGQTEGNNAYTSSDLRAIFHPWLTTSGYPLLNVSRDSGNTVYFQQTAYGDTLDSFDMYLAGEMSELESSTAIPWTIPVWYQFIGEPSDSPDSSGLRFIADQRDQLVDDSSVLFLANVGQRGYYRVQYSQQMWDDLYHQLMVDHTSIPAISRAQLIDDIFHLARAGIMRESEALKLTHYLHKETDFAPWEATLRNIEYLLSTLTKTRSERTLMSNNTSAPTTTHDVQKYLLSRLVSVYNEVGWTASQDESINQRLLRCIIIERACESGHFHCRVIARQKFLKWLSNSSSFSLEPDRRSTILCVGIRFGGHTDWDKLYHVLAGGGATSFRDDVIQALACTRDERLLQRYLNLSVASDQNTFSEEEAVSAVCAISYNEVGTHLVWTHLRDRWMDYPLGFSKGSVLLSLASTFKSGRHRRELDEFIVGNPDPIFDGLYRMAQELVKQNVDWCARNEESIFTWLSSIATISHHVVTTSSSSLINSLYGPYVGFLCFMLLHQIHGVLNLRDHFTINY